MGGYPKHTLVNLDSFLGTKRFTRKQKLAEEIKGRYIKNSKRYSFTRRTLMKRSRRRGVGLEIVRPSNLEVVKKVKTLKKLVPNSSTDTKGLDRLFRETADYILALQMRIQFMQIMVNELSSTPPNNIKIE